MKMNPEIKTKWVDRLRTISPDTQGVGVLRDNKDRFCCLGILCEIAVEEGIIGPPRAGVVTWSYGPTGERRILPEIVRQWAELNNLLCPFIDGEPGDYSLAIMNDSGMPFREIASVIEANL